MWTVCPERDRDSLQSVNSKIADRNVGKGKEIQFYWINSVESDSSGCQTMPQSMIFLIILGLVHKSHFYAQPQGYTDDPYVDDDKFVEKGKIKKI